MDLIEIRPNYSIRKTPWTKAVDSGAEAEAVIGARTRLVNTINTRFPQRPLRRSIVRGGTEACMKIEENQSG